METSFPNKQTRLVTAKKHKKTDGQTTRKPQDMFLSRSRSTAACSSLAKTNHQSQKKGTWETYDTLISEDEELFESSHVQINQSIRKKPIEQAQQLKLVKSTEKQSISVHKVQQVKDISNTSLSKRRPPKGRASFFPLNSGSRDSILAKRKAINQSKIDFEGTQPILPFDLSDSKDQLKVRQSHQPQSTPKIVILSPDMTSTSQKMVSSDSEMMLESSHKMQNLYNQFVNMFPDYHEEENTTSKQSKIQDLKKGIKVLDQCKQRFQEADELMWANAEVAPSTQNRDKKINSLYCDMRRSITTCGTSSKTSASFEFRRSDPVFASILDQHQPIKVINLSSPIQVWTPEDYEPTQTYSPEIKHPYNRGRPLHPSSSYCDIRTNNNNVKQQEKISTSQSLQRPRSENSNHFGGQQKLRRRLRSEIKSILINEKQRESSLNVITDLILNKLSEIAENEISEE